MTTEFQKGHNIVDQERNPDVFHKADALTMAHEPALTTPVPQPDSVSLNGEQPSNA